MTDNLDSTDGIYIHNYHVILNITDKLYQKSNFGRTLYPTSSIAIRTFSTFVLRPFLFAVRFHRVYTITISWSFPRLYKCFAFLHCMR